MGPGPAAVVMPDRSQQQLALEHAERVLHHRQLDVRLPELLGRPAPLITPQQASAIAGQCRPELLPIPTPAQPRRLGLRHRDRHEQAGLGEAALQAADTLEELVTALQAPPLDPLLELLQGPRQAPSLAAADGTLLLAPRPAAGQEIVDAPPLEQLHLDIRIVGEALPAAGAQVLREHGQLTALGGQEIPPAG